MKTWGTFLLLFLLLFSPPSRGASLKGLLTKLENDLKKGAPAQVVEKDLKEIEKEKRILPVYHLPELNYLLKREVEKTPTSQITTLKELLTYVEPLRKAIKIMLFLLLFYTFIFYTQNTKLEPDKKRLITLASILILSTPVLLNLTPFFFFLCGVGTLVGLIIKKKRTAVFLFTAALFVILVSAVAKNLVKEVKSPQFLYTLKVERDGYAPEYLIDEAIKNPTYRKVEKITTDLALGETKRVKELYKVETKDPYLLGIIYNDIGYAYFLKGEFKKALKAFKEANNFIRSPKVLFNLYITYASLLEFKKANEIKKELLREKVDISKASPVPLLIHVKAGKVKPYLPIVPITFLFLGVITTFITENFLKLYTDRLNPEILKIPGMMSFINSNFKPFILFFVMSLIINFILGKVICNT
ncbi:hypothetical protein [Thermovibrio sp.]